MIALSTKTGVDNTDGNFPLGKLVDTAVALSAVNHQDIHTFFDRLMQAAGVTPNGMLDNDNDGYQLQQALEAVMISKIASTLTWVNPGNPTLTPNAGSITVGANGNVYNKYMIGGGMFHWQITVTNLTGSGTITSITIPLPTALSGAGYTFKNRSSSYNGRTTCIVDTSSTGDVGFIEFLATSIVIRANRNGSVAFDNAGFALYIDITTELSV